jgi:hypothetical protein
LLVGIAPFNGNTDDDVYEAIKSAKYEYPEKLSKKISTEAKDLI